MSQELLDELMQKPLYFTVWYEMTRRARKSDSVVNDLKEGEFYFSETEYEKFGLKKSQHGLLSRLCITFQSLGIIEKVGNKTGSKGGLVYSLIIAFPQTYEFGIGSTVGNRQGANREQIGRNNKVSNVNKDNHVSPSNKHATHAEHVQEFVDYMNNIPQDDLERFHKTYSASKEQIQTQGEALARWFAQLPKSKQENRKASLTLQNALLNKFEKRSKEEIEERKKEEELVGILKAAGKWKE